MSDKKTDVEQLSRDEQSAINGGIPYEKPVFLLLDGAMMQCTVGWDCSDGSSTSCSKGKKCGVGDLDQKPF